MKYKVGDRVRMCDCVYIVKDCSIRQCDGANLYDLYANEFNRIFLVREDKISHLVISEITDELINRFKKEKIAWHFKNKEDYSKMLYLLSNKGIGFHFAVESPEEFFDKKKDFCLNLYSLKLHLQYGGLDNHIKDGYEIIEIMNPVYVPKKLVIDEVNGDIKVHGYSLKIINDIFYADGLRLEYQDGKLCYKGIECEVLFQGYQTMQFFEKKFKEQQDDINTLHYRLDCAKYERERYLKENNDLKQMIKNQQFVIQSHREKLGTIRDVLDED